MYCTPLVFTPFGWLTLGIGGYVLYRLGKKKGKQKIEALVPAALVKEAASKKPTEKGEK